MRKEKNVNLEGTCISVGIYQISDRCNFLGGYLTF